jgi:hypothetical protein
MVSDHCLPVDFIPFIVKSSSAPSHHLLHGLPPFLVPSLVAVAFGLAFFQHDQTILVRGIL